jgi:hypothetical protein
MFTFNEKETFQNMAVEKYPVLQLYSRLMGGVACYDSSTFNSYTERMNEVSNMSRENLARAILKFSHLFLMDETSIMSRNENYLRPMVNISPYGYKEDILLDLKSDRVVDFLSDRNCMDRSKVKELIRLSSLRKLSEISDYLKKHSYWKDKHENLSENYLRFIAIINPIEKHELFSIPLY